MAPFAPDQFTVKPDDSILVAFNDVGCPGAVSTLNEAEAVEPNALIAVTITAYVVPPNNPVKVAVLLATESLEGVTEDPFNV